MNQGALPHRGPYTGQPILVCNGIKIWVKILKIRVGLVRFPLFLHGVCHLYRLADSVRALKGTQELKIVGKTRIRNRNRVAATLG